MSTCVHAILFDVYAAKLAIRAGRSIAAAFARITFQSQYRALQFVLVRAYFYRADRATCPIFAQWGWPPVWQPKGSCTMNTILVTAAGVIAVVVVAASIVDGWIGLLATLASDVLGAMRRPEKGSPQ